MFPSSVLLIQLLCQNFVDIGILFETSQTGWSGSGAVSGGQSGELMCCADDGVILRELKWGIFYRLPR